MNRFHVRGMLGVCSTLAILALGGTIAPPALAGDKVVYSKPDLLWQNQTTGEMSTWLLNSGTVTGTKDLSAQCGSANGCASEQIGVDAQANSVLWNNPTTGQLTTWTFDGSANVTPSVLSWPCTTASGCAPTWHPIGRLGSTSRGADSGLLWYDATSGALSIWNLSGSTVTGTQALNWTCGAGCAGVWRPITTTDINNDGNTDVLWYDEATGVVSAWLMNASAQVTGTQALSWQCTKASGCSNLWRIIGAADVNGDGHTDVTWYDRTSGQVSSWLLDGTGAVTGTQALSWTCDIESGCANTWSPLGFISFPQVEVLTASTEIAAYGNGGVIADVTFTAVSTGTLAMTLAVSNSNQLTGFDYILACNVGDHVVAYAGNVSNAGFNAFGGSWTTDSPGTEGMVSPGVASDWANIRSLWGPTLQGSNFQCQLTAQSSLQETLDSAWAAITGAALQSVGFEGLPSGDLCVTDCAISTCPSKCTTNGMTPCGTAASPGELPPLACDITGGLSAE